MGGYAYGTGHLVYHDLTDPDSVARATASPRFTSNGLPAPRFGGGHDRCDRAAIVRARRRRARRFTRDPARDADGARRWRTIAGARRLLRRRPYSAAWLGGTAYGIERARVGLRRWPDRHGRTLRARRGAINAPLAVGLGYPRGGSFSTFPAGQRPSSTAAWQHRVGRVRYPRPSHRDRSGDGAADRRATASDVMPTVVSDGIELAPGLGTAARGNHDTCAERRHPNIVNQRRGSKPSETQKGKHHALTRRLGPHAGNPQIGCDAHRVTTRRDLVSVPLSLCERGGDLRAVRHRHRADR